MAILIKKNEQTETTCIMGIDPSLSGTGIVVLNTKNNSILNQSVLTSDSKDSIDERLDVLVEMLQSIVYEYFPNIVVRIEGLAFAAIGKIAELGALHYMIRAMLIKNNIPFLVVPPTVWKKYAMGKGNAKKDLLLKTMYKKWGFDTESDDIAVAYCLAKIPEEIILKSKEKHHAKKSKN